MNKINVNISDADLKILTKESKKGKDEKIRNKSKVLLLRHDGKTEKEIRSRTGLSVTTIVAYIKKYNDGGIENLYKTNHKGQGSKLNEFIQLITENFELNPPQTIDEAIIRIYELTGILRTRTSITSLLKKTGLLTKRQGAFHRKPTK